MAGNWLFCNRRWLNPKDPKDRMNLEYNYDALTAKFPAFARCPRFGFLQCLTEVCTAASSERANDYRTANLSPSPDADLDREDSWTPESTPPPASAAASCSPVPIPCASAAAASAVPPPPAPAAAAWESLPASAPSGNYLAEISLEIGIKRASSADADFSWPSGHDTPTKRRRAAPAAAPAAPADDGGRAAWFAAAWAAGGAGAGLNAGEAVDMGLYQHWVSVPTLRVDPSDLESFGRSTSF
jgi:hypothetical protein